MRQLGSGNRREDTPTPLSNPSSGHSHFSLSVLFLSLSLFLEESVKFLARLLLDRTVSSFLRGPLGCPLGLELQYPEFPEGNFSTEAQ